MQLHMSPMPVEVQTSRDKGSPAWLPWKRAPHQLLLAAAAVDPAEDSSRNSTSTVIVQASREQMMLPDRVIKEFPQCYTPESSLQLKKDWDIQAIVACNNRGARPQLWDPNKMSKVVVVGDFNVGKTCILKRFCKNVFLRGYKATIGVDFEIERFDICGVPFSLQIWDTAGQERFRSVASAFYRGAMVIVSVFDMANIKSLDHARQWLQESLKENEPESLSIFLVGNKTDLLPRQERWRTEKDAISIAKEMNAEFWAVSAKTGENIQDFFFRVAALAFESCVLKEVRSAVHAGIGLGDGIGSDCANMEEETSPKAKKRKCCR